MIKAARKGRLLFMFSTLLNFFLVEYRFTVGGETFYCNNVFAGEGGGNHVNVEGFACGNAYERMPEKSLGDGREVRIVSRLAGRVDHGN